MDTCGSCGKQIIWAISRHGIPMPFDAEPAPDGRYELVEGEDTEGHKVLLAQYRLQGALFDAPVYRSHFADCPDADRWRKRERVGSA